MGRLRNTRTLPLVLVSEYLGLAATGSLIGGARLAETPVLWIARRRPTRGSRPVGPVSTTLHWPTRAQDRCSTQEHRF